MSKQANKTAIGVFVVGAVALAVAAIVIFGSGKFFTTQRLFVAFFQGSVKGLRVGAPVMFRGVRVGQVNKIMIFAHRRTLEFTIPVIFQLNPESFNLLGKETRTSRQRLQALIKRGLRAQLQMQSMLTGQLMINLDFFPKSPVRLAGTQGMELGPHVVEIPTIQTSLQKIEETIQEIPIAELARSVKNSLDGIERLATSSEIPKSLRYLRQTLKDVRNLVRHVDEKVDPLLAETGQTLKDAQALLRNVDRQVAPLAGSIRHTADDARQLLNTVNSRIPSLMANLSRTLQSAHTGLNQARVTLATINSALEDGSPLRYQVSITLGELGRAAQSLRILADYLDQHPDALLRGKPKTGGK